MSAEGLKSSSSWKGFAPAFIVVFNSLAWYTLTYLMFNNAITQLTISANESLMLFVAYYVAAALSVIFGSIFFARARDAGLLLWMLAGTVMTVLLTTIMSDNMSINMLISFLFGISVGVGFPSCLAYFADATRIEHRGIQGGITWTAIGIGSLVLALLVTSFDSFSTFAALAIWRLSGLVAFFFLRNRKGEKETGKSPAYRSILRRRDVLLYLVPWIMFCFVNFTETPILQKLFGDFYVLVTLAEFALIGIFSLIGGLLADTVGRKRVVITGFVTLGIAYALLSFASGTPISWYLYTAFDGFAWGMFAAVFFMTLWGDLGEGYEKEKYYALGGLPYLLAGFLPIVVAPYVDLIGTVAAFSLASFFLFLAVLPLMYAPETLPEKSIKERELKSYVEKAKKAKEKFT